jgi:hypothetical protein
VADGPPPRKVPSVFGYVAAALLAVLGIAAGIALIVSGIHSYIDKVEGFERVDVPGSAEVALDDGGYSIYFERAGLDREESLPRITVAVTDPDGSPVALERYDSDVSYSVSGFDGRGVYTFQAEQPGAYRIRTDGSEGQVAVGRGIGAEFAGSVVAGIGTLLLAPLLGALLALVTFLRRSRAKRAVRPQWGGATGWR